MRSGGCARGGDGQCGERRAAVSRRRKRANHGEPVGGWRGDGRSRHYAQVRAPLRRGPGFDVRKRRVDGPRRWHNPSMPLDSDACYRALATHDPRFDGRFFVGVSLDAHLLPARLHGAPAAPRELPLLRRAPRPPRSTATGRACAAGRSSRPGNASVDAGARLAQGAVDLIENGVLDDGGIEHLSARVGRDEPAPAAHLRRGVRRVADRVRADAAAAAREAPAHRHGAAGHRGRARQRVRERAALQRAVQGALSDGARAGCARRAGAEALPAALAFELCVPPAVRLGVDAGVPAATARSTASRR